MCVRWQTDLGFNTAPLGAVLHLMCMYTHVHIYIYIYTQYLVLNNLSHTNLHNHKKLVQHRNARYQRSCLVVPLEAHNLFGLCNVVVQVWFRFDYSHNLSAQPGRLSTNVRETDWGIEQSERRFTQIESAQTESMKIQPKQTESTQQTVYTDRIHTE